jgi:predicted enzyme related to lactoylglutathione lyase
MAIQRMDNVAIVVADLDAAVAFFAGLGMELEGRGQIEGPWADRTVGLDGIRNPPPDTLGLHRVMFAVNDIDDTVARLRAHGAELLGEVAQYESIFLLCYLRGPRASSSPWLSRSADASPLPGTGQQISMSYAKAPMPVMSRPTIRACMVSVPSKVWMASRSAMCRMTW